MRHTVTLQGSSDINNQRIHCRKLPHLQQESVLRIQQGSHKLYAIYTPVQSSEIASLSINYMKLNLLEESIASMVKIQAPSKLKSIQIQLSPIDYQVVNNHFGLLENTFLDQVNIVWPGARIPLFYNQSNSITLIPKVQDVFLVDPYAAISFIMLEQNQNINRNKVQSGSLHEQREFQDKPLILGKLHSDININFGYENKIYIKLGEFNRIKQFFARKQSHSILCTVEPMVPFTTNPTFEEFLEYKKLQESLQVPQLKPILVQLFPSQKICDLQQKIFKQQQDSDQIQQLKAHTIKPDQIEFQCSQICKSALGLPQKLFLTEQTLNSFEISETLSLQIFLKELQSKKFRIQLQIFRSDNSRKQERIQLLNKFSLNLARTLLQNKEFAFLQNYYPFFMENQLYGLVISKKSQKGLGFEELKNFLLIRNTFEVSSNRQIQHKISHIFQVLTNSLILSDQFPNDKAEKWMPVIKLTAENRSLKHKQNEGQIFRKLFEGCYEKEIQQSCDFLLKELLKQSPYGKILFSTYAANGKTYLHKYLHIFKDFKSWFLDCRNLVNQNNRYEDIKSYLSVFVALCPFKMIFFDNIQVLIPLIEEGDQMRQKERNISHVFTIYINKLLQTHGKVGIFTTKSQANINQIIRFDKIIKLKNPNRHLRQSILHSLQIETTKNWIQEFVDKTQSLSLGSLTHYFNARQIPIKKQSKRKNDFSKIVGLQQAKRTIRSVIEKPNKYGFIYDKVKIKVPRGILLYGATGNGKTALGSSVEDEFPMKFFSVKGSDILSKYIGGSEAAVRQVFEKALSVSPAIIFFDEFESIVPRRNSSGTGVTDRVVNQFLCYLDGVSSTTGVFIIAASSRPDLIDPALLRPGRIDSHLYLDYPNVQERAKLLMMFENSVKLEVCEEQFVESTQNYSYSDLIGLLKELRIKKSSQVLKVKQNPHSQDFKFIDRDLFVSTVKAYKIGTQIREQKRQKELYENFKCGKGPEIKKQKFVQM